MTDIRILRAAPATAHLLERVAEDVFDDAIDPKRLAAYLADPMRLLVLAVAGQTVVGQCAAAIMRHVDKGDELYLDNLGVAPSFHRLGVGRSLVEEALAWGRGHGCIAAWVLTEPDNGPARGLYASAGAASSAAVMYELEL